MTVRPWQASLPMYDLPALRGATDAWWSAIASRLADAPRQLSRGPAEDALWRSSNLLFSQCCGYPYTHEYRDCLALVATPAYEALGCDGALYASAIVSRRRSGLGDLQALRGTTLAYNAKQSWSGYQVWRRVFDVDVSPDSYFEVGIETGSHRASLLAVSAGKADVTAVDSVTLALLEDTEPELMTTLHVTDTTPVANGLPYVTRADAPASLVAALRDAVLDAAVDPALAEVRQRLRIVGMEVLDDGAYDAVAQLD